MCCHCHCPCSWGELGRQPPEARWGDRGSLGRQSSPTAASDDVALEVPPPRGPSAPLSSHRRVGPVLPQPGIYGACAFLTGGNREVEADKQILSPRPLLRVREHFSFVLRAAFRGGGGAGEGATSRQAARVLGRAQGSCLGSAQLWEAAAGEQRGVGAVMGGPP